MSVHQLSTRVRQILPARLFSALRTAGNLVLAPALMSYYTGHARSALLGRPVDRDGQPLPWYTYPAIDLLLAKHLSDRDILEFGAGQSTLWWSSRARSVAAFEADPAWCDFLLPRIPGNVDLQLATDFPGLTAAIGPRRFDVIIVDGLDVPALGRTGLALRAPDWLKPGGAILLDNSDGSWSPDGKFRIMDFFRQQGFSRVDLYGFCPGNIAASCTSVFFKGPCFLFAGDENPTLPHPLAQHE